MVIDAHNHIGGPDKGDGAAQSGGSLVREMDRLGIERAVVFCFDEVDPGVSFCRANDRTAAEAAKYPERLVGFARLDPTCGEGALAELRRAAEIGLRGVKLHPSSQGFSLRDESLREIVAEAAELGLPMIFDSGKQDSPGEHFGELAAAFPGAVIIMAHIYGSCLAAAQEHPSLYVQTTGMPRGEVIAEAVAALGAERVIMGSDSPYLSMAREIEKVEALGLGGPERELVMGANMERILSGEARRT
jgi:predicted TIM-barrel fold metal-dependent hydrolase